MRSKLSRFGILTPFALALALVRAACAQTNVYQIGIFGYVNVPFVAGSNLISNPLLAKSNKLSDLFNPNLSVFDPEYNTPEGTTISLWNPATSSFATNSTLTNGSWTVDFQLPPGVGALLVTQKPFTNTFTGELLNHDGTDDVDQPGNPLPPIFTGPNGLYLLGDKSVSLIPDEGTNIFLDILGRNPFVGEQVISLSSTNTYLGNGMWDSIPALGFGQSVFLNVMSEPSPPLSIVYANGQVVVSWPTSALDWTLQTNNNPALGSWNNYVGPAINNSVTNSLSTGSLLYRLTHL